MSGCDAFILPIVLGFVSIAANVATRSGGQRCHLALLSRRSKHHAGTRYNTRGVGRDGQAANFVETEQVLWSSTGGGGPTQLAAHLQTRGSALAKLGRNQEAAEDLGALVWLAPNTPGAAALLQEVQLAGGEAAGKAFAAEQAL